MRAFPADEFLEQALSGVTVLDVRSGPDYAAAHLRGSVFIGLSQMLPRWAGLLLPMSEPLLFIAEPGQEAVVGETLAATGFTELRGFLEGGFAAIGGHAEHLASTGRVDAAGLAEELAGSEPPYLVDVREPPEWQGGRIGSAPNLPLTQIATRADEVPKEGRVILHCQGGYRSLIAASLLERCGHRDLIDMEGGFGAWCESEFPVQPAS